MSEQLQGFVREKKEDKPVLAICYDFDKTLSPDDMQAQGFIQDAYGEDVGKFWEETNMLSTQNGMDQNLAYMLKMKDTAYGKMVFNRSTLEEYGAKVQLFPGVDTWFERIRELGNKYGVIVEHYIISSGLKEMIEATAPARAGAFKKVYASSFCFDEKGVAIWPAQVVNYTNKTQFLFRIEKGVLDPNDPDVNAYFKPDELRVPFTNMVYIGDSATDIPCMKLVNSYGGHSIGVYNPDTQDKSKVYTMIKENRIRYFAAADYTENSEIERLLEKIIRRTAMNDELQRENFACQRETENAERISTISDEDKRKNNLIEALLNSGSFKNTHSLISELSIYNNWSLKQKEKIVEAAIKNQQVFLILKDDDIKSFYEIILSGMSGKDIQTIRNEII